MILVTAVDGKTDKPSVRALAQRGAAVRALTAVPSRPANSKHWARSGLASAPVMIPERCRALSRADMASCPLYVVHTS
jgi:hypothetical protein